MWRLKSATVAPNYSLDSVLGPTLYLIRCKFTAYNSSSLNINLKHCEDYIQLTNESASLLLGGAFVWRGVWIKKRSFVALECHGTVWTADNAYSTWASCGFYFEGLYGCFQSQANSLSEYGKGTEK